MDRNVVDDAEGLWESFQSIYGLQGSLVDLEISLNELVDDPVINFQHLGSLKNANGNVRAERLLINDVLILIITISTIENYKTDSPEIEWDQQLEVVETAKDLKKVMGKVSVLHTSSEDYNGILMNVRMKMPMAKNQMIHYCNSDFGHLYRFGENQNYLLVHDLSVKQLENFNKFLYEEFPHLLSLNIIINEIYQLIRDSQEQLFDIEHQMEQHMIELSVLGSEKDQIMLAIRKDHVCELEKKTVLLSSKINKYASQLKLNLADLTSKASTLQTIMDAIFVSDIESFHEYNKYAQDQLEKNDGILKKITADIENYSNQVAKLIRKLEPSEDAVLVKQKFYTLKDSSSTYLSIDKSRYKRVKDSISTEIEDRTELIESIPMEWCSSYYLLEHKPHRSLKIFSDLVNDRFIGLCITKNELEQLIKEYKFKDTQLFKISTQPGENHAPPILSKLSHIINEFLDNNINSIIYLEGLDYLTQVNDFERVVQFNNNIRESIVLNDSILIMSMKASDFNSDQLKKIMENSIDISNTNVEFEDIL